MSRTKKKSESLLCVHCGIWFRGLDAAEQMKVHYELVHPQNMDKKREALA